MKIASLLLAATLAFGTSTAWADVSARDEADVAPSAAGMAADLVLVRPLGIAGLAGGIVLFIAQLPLDLIQLQSPAEPARKLVVEPYKFTFARRLGSSEYTY